MLTILKALLSSASGVFGGIYGYLGVAILAGVLCGSGVGWTVHRVDLSTLDAIKLADSDAKTAALEAQAAENAKTTTIQTALDQQATAAAIAEAKAQTKVVTQTVTLTKEVPIYVTQKSDASVCIPYGLVRIIDAAALGGSADPSGLALPAGQSDDSCAPVKASDLAASIAANYGTANANAEQLNALESWINQQIEKANE